MNRRAILMAAVLLYATGCAFSSVNRTPVDRYYASFPRAETFAAGIDETGASAAKALEAMGFEIQSETPELGMIRTRDKAVSLPVVCDCGTWNGSVISGTGEAAAILHMEAQGEGRTVVRLDFRCGTSFTGHNLYGAPTHHEDYLCASRGIIEKEFWQNLVKILQAHRPAGAEPVTLPPPP